jgi:hypothetical protein
MIDPVGLPSMAAIDAALLHIRHVGPGAGASHEMPFGEERAIGGNHGIARYAECGGERPRRRHCRRNTRKMSREPLAGSRMPNSKIGSIPFA